MLGMITETMEKATLEVFKLPYGFQLHKHYWYSQYGEIDYSDIRFSITQTDEESDFFVAVANCHSYLNLAQINDSSITGQENSKGIPERSCQTMCLVETNLNNVPLSIELDVARNVKSIPNHTQYSELAQFRQTGRQSIACPDDQVVRQLSQEQKHFLGGKGLFVPFGDSQALFRAFKGCFHAATTQVIGVNRPPEMVLR